MADATPDYKVEQQRLKMKIAAQRQAIERSKLDILELAQRRKMALDTLENCDKEIKALEGQLEQLEQEHGPVKESDFSELAG